MEPDHEEKKRWGVGDWLTLATILALMWAVGKSIWESHT